MRLAFTIGCYRLTDFILLGVKQLRKLSPDSPILLSDDKALESAAIKQIADDHGCAYSCSRTRRGHFASDYQSLVNSVAFAKLNNADVAIKISQRLVLRRPEAIKVILNTFSDPNICVATPGQPKYAHPTGTRGSFKCFTTLSDIVMIRADCISAEDLIEMYRERIRREKNDHGSFIECAVDDLHTKRFPGRTVKLREFTDQTDDPIYLRRYQASEAQYDELAKENGIGGKFLLHEWAMLEKQKYLCKPVCV